MKVLTRRWGNALLPVRQNLVDRLNESPHPKVGKTQIVTEKGDLARQASMKVPTRRWGKAAVLALVADNQVASMKVPTRRWGKAAVLALVADHQVASMKVPTRRWGKGAHHAPELFLARLNESPRPKAEKFIHIVPSDKDYSPQ